MTADRARSSLAYLLLAEAVVILTFIDLLEPDRIPLVRDTLFFFVPYKQLLAERVARGELPLWNPYIYMGTPLLASLANSALYPLNLLLALWPFPRAFDLFLLAHYLLGTAGMWGFLRQIGLGPAAAGLGSLVFGIGGFMVSLMSLTNHLQGSSWAPWALFFWHRYCAAPSLGPWVGLTVVGAIQLLAGSPEILLLTALMVLASTFGRVENTASRWLGLAVSGLFIVGLTALQTLPTLEYIASSGRKSALPLAEVTTWSLDPISLFQLLLPHSASLDPEAARTGLGPMLEREPPWLASLYVGLVPLALAIAAMSVMPQRWRWSALIVAGLVLALGRHAPVLPALYRELPALFGKFRYPEKFVFLVHLAAAVLAARAADALFREECSVRRVARSAAAALFAVAAGLSALRWLRPDLYLLTIATLSGGSSPIPALVPLATDLASKAHRAMTILGTFLLLLFLRRRDLLRPFPFAVLVVLLVAADLFSAHRHLNVSTSWQRLREQPKIVDVAGLRDSHRRVFLYSTVANSLHGIAPSPLRGLEPLARGSLAASGLEEMYRHLWRALFLDAPMIEHVETLSGSDGITRESDNQLREVLRGASRRQAIQLLRTFSAEFLIGLEPLEDPEGLERVEVRPPSPFFVYRLQEPVPKAYLASRLRSAPTDGDGFNQIASADFRPGQEAVVAALPADWQNAPLDTTDAGRVTVLSNRPERLDLEVEAPRRVLLVLNDSYFPGWRARLDGVDVDILRANVLVRAVVVPPGRHQIGFFYRPDSFRIGALASIVTLGLLVITIAVIRKRGLG
ncbi:MAG: hypothetical protein ABW298_16800 [Candidatus Binatia bacterium]